MEQMDGSYNNPYKFNAKELDEDTGLYYYGARYYNPRLSIWYGVDPLAGKYPNWSPYTYTFDNPINYIDPDGKEGIVISGQPGGHKNKEHFLANGLDRAVKALDKRHSKSERVTWLVYNSTSKNGHDTNMLNEYKKKAEKLGINFKVMNSTSDIKDYINTKGTGENKSRDKDQITSFYYIGHAIPGTLNPGYPNKDESIDPEGFRDKAFSSGTWINCVGGCRTDVDKSWVFDDSVVDKFQNKVDEKSTISGSSVRVQYDGGVRSDEQLVKENGGNVVTVKGTKK